MNFPLWRLSDNRNQSPDGQLIVCQSVATAWITEESIFFQNLLFFPDTNIQSLQSSLWSLLSVSLTVSSRVTPRRMQVNIDNRLPSPPNLSIFNPSLSLLCHRWSLFALPPLTSSSHLTNHTLLLTPLILLAFSPNKSYLPSHLTNYTYPRVLLSSSFILSLLFPLFSLSQYF